MRLILDEHAFCEPLRLHTVIKFLAKEFEMTAPTARPIASCTEKEDESIGDGPATEQISSFSLRYHIVFRGGRKIGGQMKSMDCCSMPRSGKRLRVSNVVFLNSEVCCALKYDANGEPVASSEQTVQHRCLQHVDLIPMLVTFAEASVKC